MRLPPSLCRNFIEAAREVFKLLAFVGGLDHVQELEETEGIALWPLWSELAAELAGFFCVSQGPEDVGDGFVEDEEDWNSDQHSNCGMHSGYCKQTDRLHCVNRQWEDSLGELMVRYRLSTLLHSQVIRCASCRMIHGDHGHRSIGTIFCAVGSRINYV